MEPQDTPVASLRIELARSGLSLQAEFGDSIVDVLEAAGLEIEWNCGAGICGSCIVPVLAGRPLHHDSILDEQEQASGRVMTPCVSWASTGTLVLDL